MAGVILLETAVPFDAAEWIGVGNLYKGVPVEVSDACCDARKIPADLQATFPSTTLPVTEFLVLQLPDILEGHQKISTQTDEWFSSELPNCDSISTLWSSSIPALSFLRLPTKMDERRHLGFEPPQKIYKTLWEAGKSLFYFPLHVNGNHWIMFHVDFKRNVLGYGDSFGKKSAGSEFMPHLTRWLGSPFHCAFKNLGDMLPHPSQGDFIHCGIYAANTLEPAKGRKGATGPPEPWKKPAS
ncbi:hypothetical protein B0H14DRAFT_2560245 [Mycena olivaceomarginata]|nr:hypothetical protein B0H14DRAFT_2560245 [Mycena olivaceomarginata]